MHSSRIVEIRSRLECILMSVAWWPGHTVVLGLLVYKKESASSERSGRFSPIGALPDLGSEQRTHLLTARGFPRSAHHKLKC